MPDSIRYTCKHPGCPRRFDTREDARDHHDRVHAATTADGGNA